MAKPITPEERAAILADINAGELPRNAIARKYKRSPGTISNIARENGLEGRAFDRTATARASRAKQIDNVAVRAQLAEDHLADAVRIRERLWEPCDVVTSTGEVRTLLLPPAGDVRNFMASVGAAIKTSMEVEKHDARDDSGASAVDSWLRDVLGKD